MKRFFALVLMLSMLMAMTSLAEPIVSYTSELKAANPDLAAWSTEDVVSVLQQEFAHGSALAVGMSAEQQIEVSQLWYDLLSVKNLLFSNFDYLAVGNSKALTAALKAQVKATTAAEKAFFSALDKKSAKKFAAARDDWLDLVEMTAQAYEIACKRLGIIIPDKEYAMSSRWDVY